MHTYSQKKTIATLQSQPFFSSHVVGFARISMFFYIILQSKVQADHKSIVTHDGVDFYENKISVTDNLVQVLHSTLESTAAQPQGPSPLDDAPWAGKLKKEEVNISDSMIDDRSEMQQAISIEFDTANTRVSLDPPAAAHDLISETMDDRVQHANAHLTPQDKDQSDSSPLAGSTATLAALLVGAGGLAFAGGSSNTNNENQDQKLYFAADNQLGNRTLWSFDGEEVTEIIIPGIANPNPWYLCAYKNKLYFNARNDQNESVLWSYDGENFTELPINNIAGYGNPKPMHLCVYNNTLFFNAQHSNGDEDLLSFDGNTFEKHSIDGLASPDPMFMATYGDSLYFTAEKDNGDDVLYQYNGNTFSEFPINDYNDPGPKYMIEYNGKLFMYASDQFEEGVFAGLWYYDGQDFSTAQEQRFREDPNEFNRLEANNPEHTAVFNDRLYFNSWTSDGFGNSGDTLKSYHDDTGEYLHYLADYAGNLTPSLQDLTVYHDKLYFSGEEPGNAHHLVLWSFDGDTFDQIDINGLDNPDPAYMAVY